MNTSLGSYYFVPHKRLLELGTKDVKDKEEFATLWGLFGAEHTTQKELQPWVLRKTIMYSENPRTGSVGMVSWSGFVQSSTVLFICKYLLQASSITFPHSLIQTSLPCLCRLLQEAANHGYWPNPSLLLKSFWSSEMMVYLSIVYSSFHSTTAKLSSSRRDSLIFS